jgi:hypothetical protein
MPNFERLIMELAAFCAKNDIQNPPRISIVLASDRDKAYFLKGIQAELQPANFDLTRNAPADGEFRLRGIDVRILA